MQLTNDDIDKIAKWEPILPGFGRNDAQTAARIQSIVDRINGAGDLGCELLEDDGLSNYFVIFTYTVADVPSGAFARTPGLLIYLSACAPISVAGRSRKCVGPGFTSHDKLQIDALVSPAQITGRLEERSLEAILSAGYELWSAEEVSKAIPSDVTAYEYCYTRELWDRVFHVLFGNTD